MNFPTTYYLTVPADKFDTTRRYLDTHGIAHAVCEVHTSEGAQPCLAIVDDRPYSTEIEKLVRRLADGESFLRTDHERRVTLFTNDKRFRMGTFTGVDQHHAGDAYLRRGQRFYIAKVTT